MARVHVDSWRTTYPGIVPDTVLAGLSYSRRQALWSQMLDRADHGNHFIFVAEDEAGRIVGFADGGPEREGDPDYTGEFYAIYLLKESQGRGLGRLLLEAVARSCFRAGYASMLVWVLADNPSRHFYARLGGRPVKTKQIEIGGAKLEEVAYGWPETSRLLETT